MFIGDLKQIQLFKKQKVDRDGDCPELIVLVGELDQMPQKTLFFALDLADYSKNFGSFYALLQYLLKSPFSLFICNRAA